MCMIDDALDDLDNAIASLRRSDIRKETVARQIIEDGEETRRTGKIPVRRILTGEHPAVHAHLAPLK